MYTEEYYAAVKRNKVVQWGYNVDKSEDFMQLKEARHKKHIQIIYINIQNRLIYWDRMQGGGCHWLGSGKWGETA